MESENAVVSRLPSDGDIKKSPSRQSPAVKSPPMTVAIIGAGCMASALMSRAQNLNLGSKGINVVQGLRTRPSEYSGTEMAMSEALRVADVVILAIPCSAYPAIFNQYSDLLADKVVVDISNPDKSQLKSLRDTHMSVVASVQAALPESSVVKAFNDIGAYQLLNAPLNDDSLRTRVFSDSAAGLAALRRFVAALNLSFLSAGRLEEAAAVEIDQTSTFKNWQMPLLISFLIWVFAQVWASCRYIAYSDYTWYNAFLRVWNKSCAWTGLWLYAVAYIPGVLARISQLCTGRVAIQFPSFMRSWMKMRKELGLLALLGTVIHTLASAYLSLASYYPKYFTDATEVLALPGGNYTLNQFGGVAPTTGSTDMLQLGAINSADVAFKTINTWNAGAILTWNAEISYFLGLLATTGGISVGLTSIPSISETLNWREWHFAQSWGGWTVLVLATAHVLVLSVMHWAPASSWPGDMPGVTIMSTSIPMAVIVLKIVIIIWGTAKRVWRVMRGKNKHMGVQVLECPMKSASQQV